MLDISIIPYDDIVQYLQLNNQPVPNNKYETYQVALDLLYSGKQLEAPFSVADWVIATNLQMNNLVLPTYNISNILMSSDYELKDLANNLLLNDIDKERIIRILDY